MEKEEDRSNMQDEEIKILHPHLNTNTRTSEDIFLHCVTFAIMSLQKGSRNLFVEL